MDLVEWGVDSGAKRLLAMYLGFCGMEKDGKSGWSPRFGFKPGGGREWYINSVKPRP